MTRFSRRVRLGSCPPWSCGGRLWTKHEGAPDCLVALIDESIVLCGHHPAPGRRDFSIRFLHGWSSPEDKRCGECSAILPRRQFQDRVERTIGIGLFLTPGPAETEGAGDVPDRIVCERCA